MEQSVQCHFPTREELCLIKRRGEGLVESIKEFRQAPFAPWKLGVAKLFISLFLRDPAYQRFCAFQPEHLTEMIIEQLVQNVYLQKLDEVSLAPMSMSVEDANRSFSQLPCTRDTARRRAQKAASLVDKDTPLLLVGDDDLVSVALLEVGFRHITVLDIDPDVLANVAKATSSFDAEVRLFQHDLSAPDPVVVAAIQRASYGLVFLDPIYSIQGIEMFLSGALELLSEQREAWVFLSTSLLFLLPSELVQLERLLASRSLEVKEFHQGFNAYPIPVRLQKWARRALWLFLSGRQSMNLHRLPLQFSTSDAFVLKLVT